MQEPSQPREGQGGGQDRIPEPSWQAEQPGKEPSAFEELRGRASGWDERMQRVTPESPESRGLGESQCGAAGSSGCQGGLELTQPS